MGRFLMICLGGAMGTGARYLVSTSLARLGNFPFGTLTVNVAGSFAIGLAMTWGAARGGIREDTRLFLVTGVLGGFTTYSSFNYETLRLAQSGAPALALVNLTVTLVGCLVAGMGGVALGRALG
jgi:fluoride exporter